MSDFTLTKEELDKKIADAIKEATKELKSKNDEVIGKLNKIKSEAKAAEDAKAAAEEKAAQDKLAAEGKHEELVERIQAKHAEEVKKLNDQITTLTTERDTATSDLQVLFTDNALMEGFMKVGVKDPDYLEAVISLNVSKAKVDKDEDGKPVLLVDGKPIEEFMTVWAEEKGKAFITNPNSGGGAGGGGGGGTDDFEQYFHGEKLNLSKQAELKKADPERYSELFKKYNGDGVSAPVSSPVVDQNASW